MNWINTIFGNLNSSDNKAKLDTEITIAVLPFKNDTHKEETAYFSDGMAEEIINSLAAIPGLKVVSRNSSKGIKKFQDLHEIVQSTTLEKVIQGNFYKIDNNLKLKVELIEFNTSRTIWTKNYYEPIAETRSIIDDIVLNTLDKLNIDISENLDIHNGINKIPKFEAYDLFLEGRYNLNQREEGISIGIDQLNRSIEIDPSYAPTYSALSQCYNLLGFYEFKQPIEVYPLAKKAALKALDLNDSITEAHTSLAFTHMLYEWNWDAAEKEFLKALELNPGYATAHHWYAEFLMATGKFEEAIIQARKAQKYDPLGLIVSTLLGMTYYLSREFERAIAECEKTLIMAPNYLPVYIWLGLSYCKMEKFDEAINLFEKGRVISKNRNTKITSLLAYCYAANGNLEGTKLLNVELDMAAKSGYISAFERARIAVASGQVQTALDHLEDAFDERSTWLSWINVDPTFDDLRLQPRFSQIIAKMNFPS